ncbi:MobV family relaxase [Chamaesiphon sp.]|uniref:MobV family relaxase n=1 Tax=Chamaesiphon sp. TaxID=2814140 RepID=UPI00359377CC
MPYAIARIAKLKQSNIGGSGMHVSRTRLTPNADRSKLVDNQTLIHNHDRDLPLSEVVQNKIHSVKQQRKIRTDAVHCVEILLTASPEYFRPDDPSQYGYYQADKLDNWRRVSQQWLQQEYGDRIVRAELHLDEATPHIHAYLVPTDEAGQLNCKKLFGGRAKMFAFQDSYAAATKHLGLERGVRDSQAEHTTVKEYYAVVNAASSELELENLQVLRTKAAAYEWMKREQIELEKRLKLLATQRDLIAMELQKTQESIAAKAKIDRAIADQNPLLSIAQVAVELQLDSRELSPSMGIIDLVAATRTTNLGGALGWLNEKFGAAATAQLLTHSAQKISHLPQHYFIAPGSVKSEWGDVRKCLTDDCLLPAKLVDRLYDDGLIYSDEGRRLICLHKDFEGNVTGATAIDPKIDRQQGELVDGSSLTGGFYYFEDNAQVDAQRLVITKDPIDAMAYSIVNDPDCPTLYLATHDGRWIPADKFGNIEVVVAANLELFNLPPQAQRHLPKGKNWIADLKTLTESLLDINTEFPSVVTSLHPEQSPSAMIAQIEEQQYLDRETGERTTQQQSSPQSTPRKQRTMREQ